MKRKLRMILASILFIIGLGMFLYPSIRTAAFRHMEKNVIQQFENYRADRKNEADHVTVVPEGLPQPVTDPDDMSITETPKAFSELWDACIQYNTLLTEIQYCSLTAQSMTSPALDLPGYGWEQEVFGCLSIPSVDIETPLYLGANSKDMNRGGVILGETSLPIGGESTHCVIGGHRTWNGIMHPFVNLEQVQIGDAVYVTNPWETLTYCVIATDTIFPNDLERIHIQKGKDLLSIFTCTYPNNRRYIVICERVVDSGNSKRKTYILPWIL